MTVFGFLGGYFLSKNGSHGHAVAKGLFMHVLGNGEMENPSCRFYGSSMSIIRGQQKIVGVTALYIAIEQSPEVQRSVKLHLTIHAS